MDLYPGQVIAGKFRLQRRIGMGAMGSVWAAQHVTLDVPIALKFMNPALLDSPMALARFEREAKASAQIRSPHVVQVHDHGVDGEMPFIAMELLEGEDLGARLRQVRKLSLPEAAAIMTQAAKGLRGAHDAGIIHRDLKPTNIFLARVQGEEVVKLLDFGVAKLERADHHADATATGALVGTPHYMSPEQARGSKDLDHRTDIWSLGVILYYAITGKMPFAGDSLGDVLVKICTAPLPPASSVALDLPPAVDWFFEQACARDPKRRFQSATDLAAAFAALSEGRGAAGLTARMAPAGAALPGAAPLAGAGAYAGGRSGAVVYMSMEREPKKQWLRIALLLIALLVILILAVVASEHVTRAARGLLDDI